MGKDVQVCLVHFKKTKKSKSSNVVAIYLEKNNLIEQIETKLSITKPKMKYLRFDHSNNDYEKKIIEWEDLMNHSEESEYFYRREAFIKERKVLLCQIE